MIAPPKGYKPYFIVLSDYGGNPYPKDKERHNELEKEFNFVKDIFAKAGYFKEKNVVFILFDPEPEPRRFKNEDFFEKL